MRIRWLVPEWSNRIFDTDWAKTGAAHAVLTGYYLGSPVSSRFSKSLLQGKDVKTLEIEARQLSVRGGGLVSSLDGAKARITGRAVEMGRGTLAVLE